MKKLGLALLILLALTLALASCTMTPAQSTNPPVSGNTSYYVFFEGVEDIPFQTIPENGFATAPEAPEKEGYDFSGWQGLPDTMPQKDLVVEALFTPKA